MGRADGITLLGLGYVKWHDRNRIKHVHGYEFQHVMGMVLVGAFFLGESFLGTGRMGEMVMPNRSVEHAH